MLFEHLFNLISSLLKVKITFPRSFWMLLISNEAHYKIYWHQFSFHFIFSYFFKSHLVGTCTRTAAFEQFSFKLSPKNIFSQSFANSDEHNNPGCSYQSWGGGLTRWASKVVRLVSQEQSAKDLFLVLQCKAKQQDKNIFEWRQDSFTEVIDILKANVKFSVLTLMGVNVCSVREL